jgi:cytochrome c peroxidase
LKKKITISFLALLGIYLLLIGAGKEDGYGVYRPKKIVFNIPKGWPKPSTNYFANNQLTEQGFQLGKMLFYDTRLSKDSTVSCASCHQPFAAFSSLDHDVSHGIGNQFTSRNAPGLMNLAWMNSFHWDGAINHLEVQPLAPLTAPNEMGQTIEGVLQFLREDEVYRKMFKAAFGDPNANSERMLKAMAQFTGSLVTANSKYDQVMNGKDTFSNFEKNGYAHFKKYCASCHQEPLFTDNSYRNNGYPLNRRNDLGRMGITRILSDSLKFKVPTLRNVQLSGPYMHDGGIFSVPQVVDFYLNKINRTAPGLDSHLQKPFVLNRLQKNELVYFLYTLTDTSFTKSKRFGANGPVQFKH